MDPKILITSALPYVNNVPHLGNIIGCVLPADILNRFYKKMGINTLFVCGTDEYGTCTEIKALQENISPKELCDKYHKLHSDIYKWLNISFDCFGRTTTNKHTELSQEIFTILAESETDYIIEKTIDQLYCADLNMFVADRYVIGICKNCMYDKAKGDQCDNCQSLYDSTDLLDPYTIINNTKYKLIVKQTDHLFLNLPIMTEQLVDLFNTKKHLWSKNAIDVTYDWFSRGLQPRCITRDLKWGVPVPPTSKYGNKYDQKVLYNWFDAPIGYISITADHLVNWKDWWMQSNTDTNTSTKTKLVQTYSKDNIPFHTIIFPATLIAYNTEITKISPNNKFILVDQIASSEFLMFEGEKFSKSNNIGIFGDTMITISKEKNIDEDYWRYYLIKIRPDTSDSNFVLKNFIESCNKELVGTLGNFVNRTMQLFVKNFTDDTIQIKKSDCLMFDNLVQTINEYIDGMKQSKLRHCINLIFDLVINANKLFMEEKRPWIMLKNADTVGLARTIFSECILIIYSVGQLIEPFMPKTSNKISKVVKLNSNSNNNSSNFLHESFIQNTEEFCFTIDTGATSMLFNKIN